MCPDEEIDYKNEKLMVQGTPDDPLIYTFKSLEKRIKMLEEKNGI